MINRRSLLRAGLLSVALCAAGQAQAALDCSLPAGHEYPGFYNTDRWPRGEVVLTFDDGPHPGATPRVLDLLARHGMTATFFVVGHSITTHTYSLIQRMVAEGHTIGTHSYNHDIHMTTRQGPGVVDAITAQYGLTQQRVELALLSSSKAEFDELCRATQGQRADVHLRSSKLGERFATSRVEHRRLLCTLGFGDAERPYPMLFARPPGGVPYLGAWPNPNLRRQHELALGRLGLLNVLWNAGSRDTDRERKDDFGFLVGNMLSGSRRGGVLLMHDTMRKDALDASLRRMSEDPAIRVVPLQSGVERKFACLMSDLHSALGAFT